MNLKQILLAVATVAMLAVGQVLFKLASSKLDVAGKGLLESLVWNPTLWIALVVYGVATVAWLFVLQSTPLRMAYPFVALAFVLVPVMAAVFLGEPLRWTTFAGAALIIAGVMVSTV